MATALESITVLINYFAAVHVVVSSIPCMLRDCHKNLDLQFFYLIIQIASSSYKLT